MSVLPFLQHSLSGFARSLQERLMSLPVYDGCRPSSRYFSYNENQPDVSIEEVHRNSNSNSHSNNYNSRGVTAPSGLSITSAAAQSNSGINTSVNSSTGTSCGSSSNGSGSGNGSINESADTPDDCSVGVFLSKNYRYYFCAP